MSSRLFTFEGNSQERVVYDSTGDELEFLVRPSEETFREIRRLKEARVESALEMRKHPERYVVD